MKVLRVVVAIVGLLMIAMGLLWVGQGLNLIRWPADSFMLGEPRWSWIGTGLAAVGAVLVWAGLRRKGA